MPRQVKCHVMKTRGGKTVIVKEHMDKRDAAAHSVVLKFRSATGKGDIELPVQLLPPPEGVSFNKYNQPVISWTPDEAVANMLINNKLGKHPTLEDGRPYDDPQHGPVVEFEVAGKKIKIKIPSRPELQALADYASTARKTLETARNEYWQKEREEQDAPALKEMEEKAAKLRSQIPKGAIEVDVKEVGNADGDPIMEYSAKGIKLGWQDITIIGHASAIRPGALAGFKTETIAYVTPETLKTVADKQLATQKQVEADKATEEIRLAGLFATAKTTGKPQVISSWVTQDCMNGNKRECSFDAAHKLAMPDGTTKIEYTCCY